MTKKKEEDNKILIIVLFIAAILVFLFPTINDLIKNRNKHVEVNTEEEEEISTDVSEETIEEIHFPMMRNSIYNSDSYYKLDTFTISNMSNNDILLSAFLDLYEGNIKDYNGYVNCTNSSKLVETKYIDLRIDNIINRNIDVTYQNFYVPEDYNYPGNWIISGDSYVYEGLCNSNISSVKYYDLKTLIEAKQINKDQITLKYYMGFVKVEGDSFTIYSDASYTNELISGTGVDNMQSVFDNVDNSKKKIYQYTFNNTYCTYDEYCIEEGKWINE